MYENVSTIKSSIIRKKICLNSSSCGAYYLKIDYREYFKINYILYNVNRNQGIQHDTLPLIPDEVRDILRMILSNRNQLTTFDWMDIKEFLINGDVFEVYTGYGSGSDKVNNAVNEAIRKTQSTAMTYIRMALFVFYIKNSSTSLSCEDFQLINNYMSFVDTEIRFVFYQNTELNENEFSVQLLLTGC